MEGSRGEGRMEGSRGRGGGENGRIPGNNLQKVRPSMQAKKNVRTATNLAAEGRSEKIERLPGGVKVEVSTIKINCVIIVLSVPSGRHSKSNGRLQIS